MKKLIIILIPILIIVIVGGVFLHNFQKEPAGVIQADIVSDDLVNAFSLASKDDNIMFCTMSSEGENEFVYLALINAGNGKLKSKTKITDLELVDGCTFGEDNTIIITDGENKKQAKYTMDMKLIEVADYTAADDNLIAQKSPFYTGEPNVYKNYSTFISDTKTKYTYFYNDLNTIYLLDNASKYDVASYQNKLLNVSSTDNTGMLEYCVEDYKNSSTISTQQIKCAENYSISDYLSCIGDKYAFVIVFESDEKNDKFQYESFCWNYKSDNRNKDNGVKAYSIDEFNELNNSIISDLADKYKIKIEINNPNSFIESRVEYKEDYKLLEVNNILSAIQDFTEKLPDGMIAEMRGNYSFFDTEYTDIRIDIVNEICTENVDAFAEKNMDEMQICFGIREYKSKNISHEFMHLIDTRIEDYLGEDNLFDYWISETGQEYNGDNKDDTTQFISEYAATNETEDRAEMFAFLFTHAADDEKPDELKNEVINKKATILCQLIHNAFPSVKSSSEVCWEKFIALPS